MHIEVLLRSMGRMLLAASGTGSSIVSRLGLLSDKSQRVTWRGLSLVVGLVRLRRIDPEQAGATTVPSAKTSPLSDPNLELQPSAASSYMLLYKECVGPIMLDIVKWVNSG